MIDEQEIKCNRVMHPVPKQSLAYFKCAVDDCKHKVVPAEDVAYCSKCEYGVCRMCVSNGVAGGHGLRAKGLVSVVSKDNLKNI